ncbi:hypothetical protein ACFFX1_14830 [Dactylosporangium sucinum]|uniref:Uncharacterized protein n=1 Tax=Dactylosporangium sucinum TaxID=1424081 RepID=A0A917X447_9ACTN|nr:hypothetical protein [Dactylosporangium sucinum]GGM68527.1 hypothetical protein GCM10007977_082860 [Dactylosporangium sucinum]
MSSTAALVAIVLLLLILVGAAAVALGRFRRPRRRRGRQFRSVSTRGENTMREDSSIDPAAASAAPPPFQAPPPMDADNAGAQAYAAQGGGARGMDGPDAQQATHRPRAADDARSQYAVPVVPQAGIWDTTQAQDLRRRWHEVESGFVADPPGSVTEARQLLDEAMKALADNVYSREEQLERGGAQASDSIAGMRDTVLQYHQMFDRLLSV